jgi:hypothetical protein
MMLPRLSKTTCGKFEKLLINCVYSLIILCRPNPLQYFLVPDIELENGGEEEELEEEEEVDDNVVVTEEEEEGEGEEEEDGEEEGDDK